MPIWALYNQEQSKVKEYTGNNEAKPKPIDTHLPLESKEQSRGQSNQADADQGTYRTPKLEAKPSDDSMLHPMDRVEENEHKQDVINIHQDSDCLLILCKQLSDLNLLGFQDDDDHANQQNVEQHSQSGELLCIRNEVEWYEDTC